MWASCKINNKAKQTNSANNGDRKTKFGSADDGYNGEYNDGGFVEIYCIVAIHDAHIPLDLTEYT